MQTIPSTKSKPKSYRLDVVIQPEDKPLRSSKVKLVSWEKGADGESWQLRIWADNSGR